MKYGTCFIIALVVDEKFLDVESHSLMLTFANVAWRVIGLQSSARKVAHAGLKGLTGKTLHPVTFYEIQLLALFPQ